MDWSDFRDGLLRSLLGDLKNPSKPSLLPTFPDGVLLTFVNAALLVLARQTGPLTTDTFAGTGTTTTYDLPDDFVSVSIVLDDQSRPVKRIEPAADSTWSFRGDPGPQVGYILHWPTASELTFLRPPASGCTYTIRYRATWPVIEEDGDSLAFLPWPWLELALAHYTCYLVYGAEAGKRSRLEQWAERPELLVDNPLEQQAEWHYKQYERLYAQHTT